MNTKIDLISEGHLYFLRNISVDNVIFSYQNEELMVLLYLHPLKEWAITGGFINRAETLDESAARIAKQQIGLDHFYLKQFKAFGGPERRNNSFAKQMNNFKGFDGRKIPEDNWLNDYFITIGYYSLIEFNKVNLKDDSENKRRWWNVDSLPPLLVDHKEIVESALITLRNDLYNLPIAKELLPLKFTLPELHTLYETILGKKQDRGNFYKKMKSLGWLIKLYERKNIGAHKSPYLHMFDPEL